MVEVVVAVSNLRRCSQTLIRLNKVSPPPLHFGVFLFTDNSPEKMLEHQSKIMYQRWTCIYIHFFCWEQQLEFFVKYFLCNTTSLFIPIISSNRVKALILYSNVTFFLYYYHYCFLAEEPLTTVCLRTCETKPTLLALIIKVIIKIYSKTYKHPVQRCQSQAQSKAVLLNCIILYIIGR